MKNYDERIESIFRKYDEKLEAKRRKSAVMRRAVFSLSGLCAVITVGFLAWKLPQKTEIKQPDGIVQQTTSVSVTTAITTEDNIKVSTSSSAVMKTTKKAITSVKTTTTASNTTSAAEKTTTAGTETTQADNTSEVTAPPVTTTVFVSRPPDYNTEWNEVDIKLNDPNQHNMGLQKSFDLDRIINEADLVFSGTITDRKEYEVSWTDDNGENWGPFGNSVIEVTVNEVYYGQTDRETLKIYFPYRFRQAGNGIFGLNDDQEYIFIANAFDDDYFAHLAESPLDRTEPYKHADMYINGIRDNTMPIINGMVLPYMDFFKNNESILSMDIPYEEVRELLPEEAKYPTHLRLRKEDMIGALKELFKR